MRNIPSITIPMDPSEGGHAYTYYIPEDGGVEIYDAETGDLIMFLSRNPTYVYPLLQMLAERCPDLVSEEPAFVKYRRNYKPTSK